MRGAKTSAAALVAAVLLAGCVASPRFTSAKAPRPGDYALVEEGIASYYADEFNGRTTSNGERYDMHQMTAAHRTLPFNTRVRVTNKNTGQSIVVRINDRGPFKDDRIIDLSLAGAKALSLISTGTAPVRLEVIEAGDSTTAP